MKKFSTQPSENGWYEIIRKNETTNEWEPINNVVYPTEEQAKQRAEELNKDYNDDANENR